MLGILLIASGIIFLAVAIPGLSSAVALGLGCGMTALGTVLLITGLVSLIRSEQLALEQVEIKQARTRVNNELDQLSQYVFYTENVLDNLKRWSYRDLGFVRQAQEEVTNLEQDIEEIFLTLRDIRNALDNEEFFMTHAKQCLAQVGESLFQDASIDEFINLAHLSEIRQHLDINDPRWSMITKKVKGTVVRFIYVSTMYKQIKSNFEKSDFGQLRKMLLNNYKTIEEVLYQSFQKGYNRAALLSEKTRIIHTSSLLHWEKDEDKHLNIKNECASRLENFKKFRTLFLGLSEEDVIDFTGASGWDCSKLPRKELPLDGGKKKLRFKRTFADEQVGDWDRTTSLEHMTPQEEDPLDKLMDQVEQEATSVLKDQDRYWKEIETSEAKFRSLPQEDDFEKQSQIDSYIRDLDDHLSVWANQLSAAEDALIEVTDVQEHGNREMLKNIQQGLELIEDAVKATLPRVDFIQELLEKEELPLVAARMSLENSYLKISS
ncbi:IncA family protein [Chlamydia pneumoniae LPCoLN]|nr:IncA family protein [Chlamydia pneumoniae LPCoLN]